MASPDYGDVNFDSHPIDLGVPTLERVLELLDVPEESVVNVYPYGSHLMGLATASSGTYRSLC